MAESSRLVNKLSECATAIEGNDLNRADSLFKEISLLTAAETNSVTRKVVKYFAEALVRRLYQLYPRNRWPLVRFKDGMDYLGCAFQPFLWFANYTIVPPLYEAFSGKKPVHVIDFSFVIRATQYNPLMNELAKKMGGQVPPFRLTFVGPQLSKNVDHNEILCAQLSELAVKLRMDFECSILLANDLSEMVEAILNLSRTSEDETVIVKWEYELHKLLALPSSVIDLVLSKLKDLKPEIMIIVEEEANHNSPYLLDRLEESFKYYYTIFDSIQKDDHDPYEDYVVLWERHFRRHISEVLAENSSGQSERHETLDQWQARLTHAGFNPVRIWSYIGRANSTDKPGYDIIEKNRRPLLLRLHHPLAIASAWRPNPNHHEAVDMVEMTDLESARGSFSLAQDAGRRRSGMRSNFESHEGETNDCGIMMKGNTWSTECFSINQIAAAAEIFDMLEYVCHVHDLPVALTWISDRRDDDITNSRDKYMIHLDYFACFVNDVGMKGFVEACLKRSPDLEEGQAIAGKALVSNMHFVPDVSKLDANDYPFVPEAWDFGLHAVVAIKLANTYTSSVDYVLELFLPQELKETLKQRQLLNEVSSTLRDKCSDSWSVCREEINGDNIGSKARLDLAGTSTIIDHDATEATNTTAAVPEASFWDGGTSTLITEVAEVEDERTSNIHHRSSGWEEYLLTSTIMPAPISTEVRFGRGETSTYITEEAEAWFKEGGMSSPSIQTRHNSVNCPSKLFDGISSFLMNSPAASEQSIDQIAARNTYLDMFRQEIEQIPAIEPVDCANAGSNKRRRSEVWNYFDIDIRENGEVWGKCKGCGKRYRAESTRGTSNFNRHLKNCPRITD